VVRRQLRLIQKFQMKSNQNRRSLLSIHPLKDSHKQHPFNTPIFPCKSIGDWCSGKFYILDALYEKTCIIHAAEHISVVLVILYGSEVNQRTIWFVTDVTGNGDTKSNIIFDQLNVINFHFRTNNFNRRLNTQTDK